jgi:hypothetical protein
MVDGLFSPGQTGHGRGGCPLYSRYKFLANVEVSRWSMDILERSEMLSPPHGTLEVNGRWRHMIVIALFVCFGGVKLTRGRFVEGCRPGGCLGLIAVGGHIYQGSGVGARLSDLVEERGWQVPRGLGPPWTDYNHLPSLTEGLGKAGDVV